MYNVDPLKLEKTLYEAGFKSKSEEASDEEKVPSRIPYEQKAANDHSSKSPRNVLKRKPKKKSGPAPIDDKIHQVQLYNIILWPYVSVFT